MQCTKCTINFTNLDVLFKHIEDVHDKSGKDTFKCTLCNEILKNFVRFKKHVRTCFAKNNELNATEQLRQAEFLQAYNDVEMEDPSITAFRSKIKDSALHLVAKMSANMNSSRALVFENISNFQVFMNEVIDGILFTFNSL